MSRARVVLSMLAVVAALACSGGGEPVVGTPDQHVPPDVAQETSQEDALAEPGADAAAEAGDVTVACEDDQDCLDPSAQADPCRTPRCDVRNGQCGWKAVADFTPCPSLDACSPAGVCKDGACERLPVNCDDDNPCTDDSCDPAKGGCVHAGRTDQVSRSGKSTCDDQNACTPMDQCQEGACVGVVNVCPCNGDLDCLGKDDGDLCNGTLACGGGFCVVDPDTVVACPVAESDPCSPPHCDPATGTCFSETLPDDTICDDSNACTTGDRCESGACKGDDVASAMCDDGNPCTDDSCDPAGGCVFAPSQAACDDGNGCTSPDACQAGKCVGKPTALCGCFVDGDCKTFEDGNACNGFLRCRDGTCLVDPWTVVECDTEGDTDCRKAVCDPKTGECGKVAVADGRPCDDHDACTPASTCQAGECVGSGAMPCDDGNVCTVDSCNATAGCVHAPATGVCDDHDVCTTGDHCADGACAGSPIGCDDGNPCTDDACHPVAGCSHVANDAVCDDGSACTTDDRCRDGWCVGEVPADCDDHDPCTDDLCDPQGGCAHAANAAPCEDGDACTVGDSCSAGKCEHGAPRVCDDGNMCTADSCDPATGCVHSDIQGPCDDGDPCTVGDTCVDGGCAGPLPADCSDGNPCTDDSCAAPDGCVHQPGAGACDDHDPCTTGDRCEQGLCIPTGETDCSDGKDCTLDWCDGETGVCMHEPRAGACEDGNKCTVGDACAGGECVPGAAPDCDDKNKCTTDSCDPAKGCVHLANTLPCDDGNACTTGDACDKGACAGGPAPNCDDQDPCTDDSCDSATGCAHVPNADPCDDGNPCTEGDACTAGRCVGAPVACDDSNICTSDACIPPIGCVFVANANNCEDGDACTVDDYCQDKACHAGAKRSCDDHNQCTTDSCNPATGCVYAPWVDGMPCDDGNSCTVLDKCLAGKCVGQGQQCDDGNPCTDDKCNAEVGCYYVANSNACDDGSVCTVNDRCSNKQCVGQATLNCDDGNACTSDLCDPKSGCFHVPAEGPCSDSNACTTDDACVAGKCVGGPAPDCDDANLCTTDTCDPVAGCVHAPNTLACDDLNACTTEDACLAGKCVGGPAADCDDGNVCTTDKCYPDVGCVHVFNSEPCSDGSACTEGDACLLGRCVGQTVACDDQNACTTDSCNPATGCVFTPNTQPCEDGKVCTVGDRCGDGKCVPGPANACDDGDVCTDDGCAEPAGCWHELNTASCNDGNACTTGDVCSQGVCTGPVAVDCDDKNECTIDSCDKATGCVHEDVAVGTPCGGKYSICWNGSCVTWEFKTAAYPGSNDTRLYEGGRADVAGGLYASGSASIMGGPGITTRPMVFTVTEVPLDLVFNHIHPSQGAYLAQGGHVAGGSGGLASHWVPNAAGASWIETGAPPFPATDLLAATRLGQYEFLAGKALGGTKPSAAVHACVEDKSYNFSCLAMPVVTDRTSCATRAPDLRGAWAFQFGASARVFFAGSEPSLIDWPTVVIATWDGAPAKCSTTAAGEALTTDPYSLYVAGGATGPGSLNDVHGLSLADAWAVGEKGTIYRLAGDLGGWKKDSVTGIGATHDLQAVWVDAGSGVHVVGVRLSGDMTVCKTPFYLHAARTPTGYVYNNYMEFEMYTTCGTGITRLNLADVTVDPVSGSVYGFGWVPNNPASPTSTLAVVMRLAKP